MWDMPAMSLSPGDQALKIGADLKQFMRVNQVVGSKDLTPTSISSSWWVQYDYFKYCAQSDLYFNFYYLTSTTSVSRFGQTSHLRWHTAQQGGDLAECKVELSSWRKLNSPQSQKMSTNQFCIIYVYSWRKFSSWMILGHGTICCLCS